MSKFRTPDHSTTIFCPSCSHEFFAVTKQPIEVENVVMYRFGGWYAALVGAMVAVAVGACLIVGMYVSGMRSELKGISMELRRMRTPAEHRTDTENGFVPPDKPNGDK